MPQIQAGNDRGCDREVALQVHSADTRDDDENRHRLAQQVATRSDLTGVGDQPATLPPKTPAMGLTGEAMP
jgi:hypothetical protein